MTEGTWVCLFWDQMNRSQTSSECLPLSPSVGVTESGQFAKLWDRMGWAERGCFTGTVALSIFGVFFLGCLDCFRWLFQSHGWCKNPGCQFWGSR